MTIWYTKNKNSVTKKGDTLNVYVVEQGDLNFEPPDFLKTSNEPGNSYGSLKLAMNAAEKYSNADFDIKIILGEGVYTQNITFLNGDYSHISIEGATTSNRIDFNNWCGNVPVNSNRPTKEEIIAEYKSVLKGRIIFNNCKLPKCFKNVLLDCSISNLANLFVSCSQPVFDCFDLILLDDYAINNSRQKTGPSVYFNRCQHIVVSSVWGNGQRPFALANSTHIHINNRFLLDCTPTIDRSSNFDNDAALRVQNHSSISFYQGPIKTIYNGFINIVRSSTLVNSFRSTIHILNNELEFLEDGVTLNNGTTYSILIDQDSHFVSDNDSTISFNGGNLIFKVRNNSSTNVQNITIKGTNIKTCFDISDNSNLVNNRPIILDNVTFETFSMCSDSSFIKFTKEFIVKNLDKSIHMIFVALNNSYIENRNESGFVYNNSSTYNLTPIYVPSLNTGYNTSNSRIFDEE